MCLPQMIPAPSPQRFCTLDGAHDNDWERTGKGVVLCDVVVSPCVEPFERGADPVGRNDDDRGIQPELPHVLQKQTVLAIDVDFHDNMFDPRTGAASGVFVLNNLTSPVWAICTMMGALENVTSPETGKLCAQYVGPALRQLNFNNLPIPINPFLTSNPPDYMLRYSEHDSRPENEGQPPPPLTDPPAVSAYTGAATFHRRRATGRPRPTAPVQLPMAPPPAPPPPTLQDMLLPAEAPPPPVT